MRIKGCEKLTNEKWINLFRAEFEHNGHEGRWVFASRKPEPHTGRSSDAVIIVPVLKNPGESPKLVMIREFRIPVGDYVIGLPAGLIDPGETVATTVRREIHEETGLKVTTIERISSPLFSSSGLTDEAAAMAFVTVQGDPAAGPNLEPSECLEVMFLDYEGICALCNDPVPNVDAKAWTVLYMYQQLGAL